MDSPPLLPLLRQPLKRFLGAIPMYLGVLKKAIKKTVQRFCSLSLTNLKTHVSTKIMQWIIELKILLTLVKELLSDWATTATRGKDRLTSFLKVSSFLLALSKTQRSLISTTLELKRVISQLKMWTYTESTISDRYD